MAVTITMAADVTMDVITAGDFPAEIIPAAIFFGSSFFYACAEITDGAATTDVVTETAAGSLSYCFCCVAMDVAAAADNHYLPAEGNFPLPFSSVLIRKYLSSGGIKFQIAAIYVAVCFLYLNIFCFCCSVCFSVFPFFLHIPDLSHKRHFLL